ncbi:MAG: glycosyltransferase family protein [Bacteroides sp.]|nr:glycosyltransferase family protein [Roseburia sp.]MCM1345814.1 glycosyltransferase family protein [Bacteroides sp.]MCM1421279.1 glycosyltransferase family protein [Bacteroides sp.]
MISIIICSRTKDLPQALHQNIAETIGCEYELVIIDNSHNDFDIFSAYNHGVERAKGDILCFMHDDIYFHTQQWGIAVEEKFNENANLGLIGIIGGHVQPLATDWRVDSKYASIHYLQRAETLEISPRHNTHTCYHICKNSIPYGKDGTLVKVATVDGVWFCIPRYLFKDIRFDDKTFEGFHIYDLDISMQVLQAGKDAAVCNNIEIEHFSGGLFTHEFMKSMQQFNEKYQSVLPAIEGIKISEQEKAKIRTYTSTERLQKRIERDELRKRIIAKQYAIRKGQTGISLTEEEDLEGRKTVFRYMRYVMKVKKNYSFLIALKSLIEYISDKRNPYRYKLVTKFVYYRLIEIWRI